MSGSAQVRSVEAIESFRATLADFEQRVQGALDVLASELRRANLWLEQDCPQHWKEQTKQAEDAMHQAKLDLERCLMFPVADEKPACREERATLKTAKDRWAYCHEKRGLVKHWRGVMHHELFEYNGRVGHLRRLLESDLPAARAKLQVIMRRIEGYQIERPPSLAEAAAEQTSASVRPETSSQQPATDDDPASETP